MINTGLTIGADPEIAIFSPVTSHTISAQTLFNGNSSGRLGLDGNPSTLEIRPKYSTEPLEVADDIFKILDEGRKQNPQIFRLNLQASSNELSIGGHIHLGHEKIKSDGYTALVQNLDTLLAIPLSFLEVPQHHLRRINNYGYGKMGPNADHDSARRTNWGVEYRVLPSWLATRELTESALCVAYLIGNKYIQDGEVNNILNKLGLNYEDLVMAYNTGVTSLFKPWMKNIITEIKSLDGAEKYKKQINYLIKSAREGRPILATEIKDGWHIKFIRLADLKLSDLSSLIKKLGKALLISTEEDSEYTSIQEEKLLTAGNDFRVEDIANNCSRALMAIVGQEILYEIPSAGAWKVRGTKKDAGNIITIKYSRNDNLSPIQIKILEGLILNIYNELKIADKPVFKFEISFTRELFLPRVARDSDTYLSEAVALIVWLFTNREVYKSKTQTKSGKVIKLPFSVRNSIHPLCLTLKPHKRGVNATLSSFFEDGGSINIPKLREFCITTLLPRILNSEHGSPRVTPSIYNALETAYRQSSNTTTPSCKKCIVNFYNELITNNSHISTFCDRHLFYTILHNVSSRGGL